MVEHYVRYNATCDYTYLRAYILNMGYLGLTVCQRNRISSLKYCKKPGCVSVFFTSWEIRVILQVLLVFKDEIVVFDASQKIKPPL
jgi:hypothetical protein